MEISQHIAAIERDGELMSAAADQAGLDAPVPSCPPWKVRELLKHQGYVHRWATAYVADRQPDRVPRLSEPELLAAGPADADLLEWFRAGHAALTQTLRTADPGLQCWTFLPAPSPLAFWARRQAHETAIHRVDAQQAAGHVSPFPADFAADGIDELIMGFFGRGGADGVGGADGAGGPDEADGQRTLLVVAADAGQAWHVTLTADGSRAAHVERDRDRPDGPGPDGRGPGGRGPDGGGGAGATVRGPASAVYLLLWNRATAADGAVTIAGDAELVKSWPEGMRVTWG